MMTPLEARLTEEVAALRLENQQFQEDNRQLRQENKLLREKIDLLVKRIFGAKSEQLDENQLMLLLQERCVAAPGLLAAIIVGKYGDHLPLYRQEQIWRTRHHIDVPRQTMVRWLAMAVKWLQSIHDCIRTEVIADGYGQTDEPTAGRQPAICF